MRENFDRIRVPLHQKREISELEQMREISGPCKSTYYRTQWGVERRLGSASVALNPFQPTP